MGVQKPGFFLNLGGDAEIVAETRFLGFWGGVELETGFLPTSGWGFGDCLRNPVSWILPILQRLDGGLIYR